MASSIPSINTSLLTKQCNYCKTEETDKKIYRCSRCHFAKYCSVDCQRKDWSEHKKICTPNAKQDHAVHEHNIPYGPLQEPNQASQKDTVEGMFGLKGIKDIKGIHTLIDLKKPDDF